MKKLRIGLNIVASVIIVTWLFIIDYSNLSWPHNSTAYLGITAMVCLILSINLSEKNNEK